MSWPLRPNGSPQTSDTNFQTPHPKPQTPNPEPQTSNPKLQTPNPNLQTPTQMLSEVAEQQRHADEITLVADRPGQCVAFVLMVIEFQGSREPSQVPPQTSASKHKGHTLPWPSLALFCEKREYPRVLAQEFLSLRSQTPDPDPHTPNPNAGFVRGGRAADRNTRDLDRRKV